MPLPTVSLTPPTLPAPDKVVATVNGQKILAGDIEGYVWDWNVAKAAQAFAQLAMLQQEATKRGVTVTDAEVQSRIQTQLASIQPRVPKGEDMVKFLKDQGAPMSRFVVGLKSQLLMEKIAEQDFKPENYVRVSSLVIRQKDETTAALSAALTSANAAYAALIKGEAWGSVLQKYSSNEQAAANHGERDWIAIADLPKEIQGAAVTTKVNGYLPPVKDQNGVEIFLVETHGKDATGPQLAGLKAKYVPMLYQGLMQSITKNAKVDYSY